MEPKQSPMAQNVTLKSPSNLQKKEKPREFKTAYMLTSLFIFCVHLTQKTEFSVLMKLNRYCCLT